MSLFFSYTTFPLLLVSDKYKKETLEQEVLCTSVILRELNISFEGYALKSR